jgi:REP-associated tyrosine transposase
MSRKPRIHFKGGTYHVFSKGNKEEYIFSDEDKDYFLDWLEKGAEEYNVDVYAYCIMGNHYHLLVQTQEDNLSIFMHYIGSAYASHISKKGWKGHVFAGRYKSICVDKEEYLLILSRYIHLNPVRAGIVVRPEDYCWSSYAYYIDETEAPCWLKKEWLCEYFGFDADSKSSYKEFVEADMESPSPYPDDRVVAQAVLGSQEFLEKVKSFLGEKSWPIDAVGSRLLRNDITLEEIYHKVCQHFGLSNLIIGEQNNSKICRRARKLFIYLARSCSPSSNQEIAEMLGDIGHACVSRHFKLMQYELERDVELQETLENAIKKIL